MKRNITIFVIITVIGTLYLWLSNNDEQNVKVSDGKEPHSAFVPVTLPE